MSGGRPRLLHELGEEEASRQARLSDRFGARRGPAMAAAVPRPTPGLEPGNPSLAGSAATPARCVSRGGEGGTLTRLRGARAAALAQPPEKTQRPLLPRPAVGYTACLAPVAVHDVPVV